MRSYHREQLEALEDPATLGRLRPLLSEPFDPISLNRPGFLQELGLQSQDEAWLRAGAYYQTWSEGPLLARGWAEEARWQKNSPSEFLENCLSLVGEELWSQAERLFLRLQKLLTSVSPRQLAQQLGLDLKGVESLRQRWKAEVALQSPVQQDQALLDGLILQLRGLCLPSSQLAERMRQQTHQRFWFFFRRLRPILTKVLPEEVEVKVAYQSGRRVYSTAASFAREIEENRQLSPELWAKQWSDYLGRRVCLGQDEFQALLDHFEENERFRWPNLVAVGGAKARRAVAAVALIALSRLESVEDPLVLERLWQMIPDFAERYELQQVVKRRALA